MSDVIHVLVPIIRNPQKTEELQIGLITVKNKSSQNTKQQIDFVSDIVKQVKDRIISIGGNEELTIEYVNYQFVINNYFYITDKLSLIRRRKITRAIEEFEKIKVKYRDGTRIHDRLTIKITVG